MFVKISLPVYLFTILLLNFYTPVCFHFICQLIGPLLAFRVCMFAQKFKFFSWLSGEYRVPVSRPRDERRDGLMLG